MEAIANKLSLKVRLRLTKSKCERKEFELDEDCNSYMKTNIKRGSKRTVLARYFRSLQWRHERVAAASSVALCGAEVKSKFTRQPASN